jgi:hypothetical protein
MPGPAARLHRIAGAFTGGSASAPSSSSQPRKPRQLPLLSDAQIGEFHDRGFIVVRGLIPRVQVDVMRAGYDAVTRGDVEGMAPRDRVASDPPGEPLMLQMGNPYRNPGLRWDEVGYLERLVSVGKQ